MKMVLIGAGRISQHYVLILKKFNLKKFNFEILGVVDLDLQKAQKVANLLKCKAYKSIDEFTKKDKSDLAIVLTSSGSHFEVANKTLLSGMHTLIEKPSTLLVQDSLELSRIAEEKHLYLATVHQNRYNKAVLFAKEVLSKNLIGKVLSVSVKLLWNRPREYYLDDWHGRWQTDGGVVSQQAFHHLDVAIDLCGSIEEVSSFGDSLLHEIEVDDTSVGVIRFTSGALGTFELTTAAPGKDREASIRILGKEGVLEVGGIALNKIVTYESSLDRRNQTRIKHLFKENFETGYGINHKKVLEIVYSDIVNGTRNYVKWSESVETLKLIHRIYQSQESRSINQISKPLYSFKLGALSEESGHGNK